MPDGFKIRNRWGTLQESDAATNDVFADPSSVVYAGGLHFEFSEYSTGEVLLTLRPISRDQPRLLRGSRSRARSEEEAALEHRFGFRHLIETFFDPMFGHKVELWELGDRSLAVRLHNLDSGTVSTLFEVDTDDCHRPF